jgi:hypothetical protein
MPIAHYSFLITHFSLHKRVGEWDNFNSSPLYIKIKKQKEKNKNDSDN